MVDRVRPHAETDAGAVATHALQLLLARERQRLEPAAGPLLGQPGTSALRLQQDHPPRPLFTRLPAVPVCRDSHIKQIYAALRCFMTDLWAHDGGECAASPDTALQFKLDDVTASGHQYRTQPRCLHLVGGSGSRICLVHSPKGDMFFGDNPQVICDLHICAGLVLLCRAMRSHAVC